MKKFKKTSAAISSFIIAAGMTAAVPASAELNLPIKLPVKP